MGLSTSYVLPTNRIPDIFAKIRDGQAPERLTRQLLKDWGFTSSNDQAFIPLLKTLGFLTADGVPTQRYHNYRDHSRSKAVLGEAIREAYHDLFLIKARPTEADKPSIEGKFKSFHNASEHVASLMTKTFFGLLALADLDATPHPSDKGKQKEKEKDGADEEEKKGKEDHRRSVIPAGLHYNIQIHLPATKDVEVYNAIFKSLKDHLLAE
jgi:hypothetical protein